MFVAIGRKGRLYSFAIWSKARRNSSASIGLSKWKSNPKALANRRSFSCSAVLSEIKSVRRAVAQLHKLMPHLEAAQIGQAQTDHGDMRLEFADAFDGLGARAESLNAAMPLGEHGREAIGGFLLVFDEQDAQVVSRAPRRRDSTDHAVIMTTLLTKRRWPAWIGGRTYEEWSDIEAVHLRR